MNKENTIKVLREEMQSAFVRVLLKHGFDESRATECAAVFTDNSIDGVYTHGVNRFPGFVQHIRKGFIKINAKPSFKHGFGSIEQWDGNLGPGPLNAIKATDRAVDLAQKNGIGCIALSNTNHWMRGGYYGWRAAKKNCVLIAWTNTIANMPAWKAIDKRLGNNPLVVALPFNEEAIVLDIAMSQFSYGMLEMQLMKNEKLPVDGGFDKKGNLTDDPSAIIDSGRLLPAGYWKGAGLALLLDILSAMLSGGSATWEITEQSVEYGVSQIFICIDINKLGKDNSMTLIVSNIIKDYHRSVPAEEKEKIIYPGERVLTTRQRNLQDGIPVFRSVWESILKL
ncbi:MAG: Malate/L-lactate dehydrogenase [Chitinophagaceae bacterium]|nr:Malate/L-lactate dehydrogenase [Chitinophagaceae bacterium]